MLKKTGNDVLIGHFKKKKGGSRNRRAEQEVVLEKQPSSVVVVFVLFVCIGWLGLWAVQKWN